jgi:hypothetical protein
VFPEELRFEVAARELELAGRPSERMSAVRVRRGAMSRYFPSELRLEQIRAVLLSGEGTLQGKRI